MEPSTKIILFGVFLVVLVFVVYVTVVRTYYWWGTGAPPPTGEEKRRLREEELELRARQIEHSKTHPIATRKSSFFDNRKVYPDENDKD